MIIVLKSGVSDTEVNDVCRRITEMGYGPHVIRGEFKTIVAAVGEERGRPDLRLLEALETVESVMPVQQPFKLASREVRRESSEVRINGVTVGGRDVVVMAGPCSVESEAQVLEVAEAVKGSGARILRGATWRRRASAPASRWSPRCSRPRAWRWWPSTATSSRSGRGTSRTSPCCAG